MPWDAMMARLRGPGNGARGGPRLAALALALWAGPAASASAAPQSRLNINVVVQGIGGVSDLTAAPGSTQGSIDLTWTEPFRNGTTGPYVYDLRVSTLGQISTPAQFLAAQPLTAFSSSPVPAPGPGAGQLGMVVTGLAPGVVHYFALRELDSLGAFGHWVRAGPRNAGNFAPAFDAAGGAPYPVTDLSALPGAAEGDVALSWTAPLNQNPVPVVSYSVRYATVPVSAFGGSTAAWASAAWAASFAPALAPGSLESKTLSGLFPAATWYFAVKSVDQDGRVSDVDAGASGGSQAFALPGNFAPSPPSGLSAAAGLRRVTVSWTDLTAAGKGLDFAHYRLERSTDDASYAAVTTMTAPGRLDIPLTSGVTCYYRVAARDLGGYESLSSTVSATPYAVAPMEPLGLTVVSDSTSTVISWSPVTRFHEGTLFLSTSAPAADELQGYRVTRSTSACAPSFVPLSTMSFTSTTITDNSMGLNYFYRVHSFNAVGGSTNVVTLSSLGERGFFVDDCETAVLLDDKTAASMLNAATNGLGADVRILSERRPQDVGGTVFQSVSWRAYLDGASELKGFVLPKPARVRLRYDVDGSGAPAPSTTPYYGVSAAGAGTGVAASAKDLGVYWHNGAEFRKMYGKVNPLEQTVTVETPNLGLYQIRALQRSAGAVFDLSNLSGRVVTPNGDGLNDLIIFTYDPGPGNAAAGGRIYDVSGGFVADMAPGLVPNTLTWDGRMNGRPAAGGVYVYKVTGDGKTFTGTVVVAK